jgi:hypothetical protein
MTVADVNTKWFNVNLPFTSARPLSGVKKPSASHTTALTISSIGRKSFVVNYELNAMGFTSIRMYSLSGALIKQLGEGARQPGNYTEKYDVSKTGISKGTYVLQLKTQQGSIAQKLVLSE